MKLTDSPPTPKYWQLAEELRHKVMSGLLQPGDRLPSLAEMQTEHNASRPTVEKAHRLLEEEGLITRRHGAGVFVALPKKKSTHGVIGLSGEGFSFNGPSSYWAQIMGGVRDAAAHAGCQLLVLDPESRAGWEKADGVLVCDWDAHLALKTPPPNVPIVSLLVPTPGVASVCADDYAGARLATEHLLELGHRKIGFLHAFGKQAIITNRRAAYHDALKQAGIRPLKSWEYEITGWFQFGNQIVAQAREDMAKWLRDDSRRGWKKNGCTALLCQNDETAHGAIEALQNEGIRVPDDVSVMGFDGTDFGEIVSPKISSIELPLREIAACGVELLLQQIEADAVSCEHRVLAPRLVVRESTASYRMNFKI